MPTGAVVALAVSLAFGVATIPAPDGESQAAAPDGSWTITDDAVFEIPVHPLVDWESFRVSVDTQTFAYRAQRRIRPGDEPSAIAAFKHGRGKEVVVANGVEGPEYDQVTPPVLSPLGGRWAYGARIGGGKAIMVRDGVAGPEYDDVANPVFSADGRRFAYAAKRGKKWFAVVDGKEHQEYDEVQGPPGVFSRDGLHFAYMARRAKQSLTVLDGTEGKSYDAVGLSAFGEDGRTLAYGVAVGGRASLVLGTGKEFPDYDPSAEAPVFARDGRVAFPVLRGGQRFMAVNGTISSPYDHVEKATFSPDGRRFAFVARRGQLWVVVVDGVEGAGYHDLDQPIFSPDGTTMAYRAWRAKDQGTVVLDGVEGTWYERTHSVVFSPDGKRLAFVATRGRPGSDHFRNILVVLGQGEKDLGPGRIEGLSFTGPSTLRLLHAVARTLRRKTIDLGIVP